jgi:hypothetical protein
MSRLKSSTNLRRYSNCGARCGKVITCSFGSTWTEAAVTGYGQSTFPGPQTIEFQDIPTRDRRQFHIGRPQAVNVYPSLAILIFSSRIVEPIVVYFSRIRPVFRTHEYFPRNGPWRIPSKVPTELMNKGIVN